MTIDVPRIFNAVIDHARKLGVFDQVNGHEPKSSQRNGISASFWVDRWGPIPSSGLISTSERLVFNCRVFRNMLSQPEDDIDISILVGVSALKQQYTEDFTLGGLIRNVDIRGQHGIGLEAVAGYYNQGGTLYRGMILTIPLLINDVFTENP
jgi:hypothetical protein